MGKCRDCGGTGKITCTVCGGTGHNPQRTTPDDQMSRIPATCPKCRGTGRIDCYACGGSGNNPYDP